MAATFTDLVERWSSAEMREDLESAFFGILAGVTADTHQETATLCARMHLLDDEESPDDILPIIAEDRRLGRYYLETATEHRARLIDAWNIYAKGASERAMQDETDSAGFGPANKMGTWGASGVLWGGTDYTPLVGALGSQSGAGTLSVPYPTGIQQGALLILMLARESAHDSAPSGWTLIERDDVTNSQAIYARIAPDPATLGANLSYTVTGAGGHLARILSFNCGSGHWITPVTANFASIAEAVSSGSIIPNPANTTGPRLTFITYSSTSTVSSPSPWVELFDDASAGVGLQAQIVNGAAAASSATIAGGGGPSWALTSFRLYVPQQPAYAWGDRGTRFEYRPFEPGPRGENPPYWSQYWVVFDVGMHPVSGPPIPWGTFVWGDTYEGVWGPVGYSQDFKRTAIGIVKKWKSSRWVFRGFVFKIGTLRTWGQSGFTWGQSGLVWGGAIEVPVPV